MTNVKERNYGIDLLRLVLIYMISMLHTLGQGGVLRSCAEGTSGYYCFWLLEALSYSAVDSFAIISGYMAVDKPRKYENLVNMWFQVFFYSFIVTLILTIGGVGSFGSVPKAIKCLFPVTFGKYWYFTAYFGLFFSIPILNRYLFHIDEKTAKRSLIVLVALYSFMTTIYDPFTTIMGYSTIWLIVMYCFGVLAKRIRLFETRSNTCLILIWISCVLITWASRIFSGTDLLMRYPSPTVLLSGFIMVVLFSRLRIKSPIISTIAPLSFGIYLFQLNQIIWESVLRDLFTSIADKPIYFGIPLALASAMAIFIVGLAVEFIRSKIAKMIGIHKMSEKIVKEFNIGIEKMTTFLR